MLIVIKAVQASSSPERTAIRAEENRAADDEDRVIFDAIMNNLLRNSSRIGAKAVVSILLWLVISADQCT